MVPVYHRTVLFLVSVIKDGREDNVNRKIRVLCLHVKIKDSVITTDQRSDVPVRMVGQEINVKQKLVVILALVMETENVVYLSIIQFVIVMQDGKDHNVSNPIRVPSNRVKTKEHAYKRDLLTHANVESVGMVKYVKQKLYVTQQLVMDMGVAVFTVIV